MYKYISIFEKHIFIIIYLSSMISIPHTSHEGPIRRWRLGAPCAPRAPGDAPRGAAAAAQPNGSDGAAGGRRQETSLGRCGVVALWNFPWDFLDGISNFYGFSWFHGISIGFLYGISIGFLYGTSLWDLFTKHDFYVLMNGNGFFHS